MRFYKIVDSDLQKKAFAFVAEKEALEAENLLKVENKIPFKFNKYLAGPSFSLVPRYVAFKPTEKIGIPKGWKPRKEHRGFIEPDARTKQGREIRNFLSELPLLFYPEVYEVLEIQTPNLRKFTIPAIFTDRGKKEVYLKIDDSVDLNPSKFEEVTLTYIKNKI